MIAHVLGEKDMYVSLSRWLASSLLEWEMSLSEGFGHILGHSGVFAAITLSPKGTSGNLHRLKTVSQTDNEGRFMFCQRPAAS